MQASFIRKNTSLLVCCWCVAIITVVVLTIPSLGFLNGILVLLCLISPLLIPAIYSLFLHTKMAHWFNVWPVLFYTAIIVILRFGFEGVIVLGYLFSHILPFVVVGIIGSWAAAWAYRKPRDLSPD
ncbi:MAG: hypothetical protein KF712_00485 [Akkermansiaceae bacterium]|nr:hypothetical protein [Akkermansiaceae bacterium]